MTAVLVHRGKHHKINEIFHLSCHFTFCALVRQSVQTSAYLLILPSFVPVCGHGPWTVPQAMEFKQTSQEFTRSDYLAIVPV